MTGRPSKVIGLPEELRKVVERRLTEPEFHDYKGLAEWIRQRGHEISPSSLRRFGVQLAHPQLATTQERATEASRAGATAATEGLLELAQLGQEKLRTALGEIKQQLEKGDMSRLAHVVAHLTQAAVSLQRQTEEFYRQTEERKRSTTRAKTLRAGLSPETSQRLRNALLGIAAFDPDEVTPLEAPAETGDPDCAPLADESKR